MRRSQSAATESKMPLKSFIEVAPESHFPIQNLPFGVFRPGRGVPRVGVAIGEYVLDLSILEGLGHFKSPEFESEHGRVFVEHSLNEFLALGRPAWRKAREVIQKLLSADNPTLRDDAHLREQVFHKQKDVVMQLPARIGDYTDFYSSYHHAHNVGTMLRGPDNALMPRVGNGFQSDITAAPVPLFRFLRRLKGQTPSPMRPRRFLARAKVSTSNSKWRF